MFIGLAHRVAALDRRLGPTNGCDNTRARGGALRPVHALATAPTRLAALPDMHIGHPATARL